MGSIDDNRAAPQFGDIPMSGTKDTPKPAQQGDNRVTDRSDETGQPWSDPADKKQGKGPRDEQQKSQHGEHTKVEPRH